jgi:ArsR family transcriptional regulator, arsenate/arsenite/antimonite-responsive transcriptional repressor
MKTELELTTLDAGCCPPLLDQAISESDAELAAQAFRALSDPTRVRLLSMVASAPDGEVCVCELVPRLEVSQPTVSHHLKVLHDAGILERERRGSWAYYRLRPGATEAIAKALTPATVG